ncbi:MAG TPA: UDP-N-acetylmuramate dehydrogenase [Jatrophihabitans sp.]|jgi:UDP-N-acetylmuramate dehydrogenase|uniref:UDP-N-acetylmuramate dehydrogenase n=1 Tax=Jatrophihabitans sp. TaxID=1932789 RepID=UPI002EF3F876
MATTLAELTTLRLGGPAGRIEIASSSDELVALVAAADAADEPVLLVGGGSNLVVGDAGWPGLVIRVASDTITRQDVDDEQLITVAAGVSWDELVARTVADGLAGLETMSGIPGLTGATPVQNVGAYGSEVADFLTGLRIYDRQSRTVQCWSPERCEFGFRSSAFKHTDRFVVLEVTFRLTRSTWSGPIRYLELANRLGIEPGATAPLDAVRATVLELRRSKGMVLDEADHDSWSVGSFFVNPLLDEVPAAAEGCPRWQTDGRTKLSAAWLIEQAGFPRGWGLDRGRGTVSVSTKHTLALTNRGGATTAELLALAAEIRAGVQARFGIRLGPEAHLRNCTF